MSADSNDGVAEGSKDRPCVICGQATPKKCMGCQSAHYCCVEHQREAWPSHKTECLRESNTKKLSVPSKARLLLVGGAMMTLDSDFWLTNFRPQLTTKRVSYDIIELKTRPSWMHSYRSSTRT